MKNEIVYQVLLSVVFGLLCVVLTSAQTVTDCPHPSGCVVISREAALKAIEDGDARKALEKENKRLLEAINGREATDTTAAVKGYKEIIHEWKEKYSAIAGEYSGFKQGRVAVDAAFEIAVKNTKKKCLPLSLCF